MTIFVLAALATMWPWHHRTKPQPPAEPPQVLTLEPATSGDPIWDVIAPAVTAQCYDIPGDDPMVIFIAKDGSFSVAGDCYNAFRKWEQASPKENLYLA